MSSAMTKLTYKRIVARCLDLALVFAVSFFIAGGSSYLLFGAIFIVVSIVGEIGFVSAFGGTIGKLVLNLRIRATDGSKVGVLLAIHRTCAVWVAIVWAYFLSLVPGRRAEPSWPSGSEDAHWDDLLGTEVVEV